VALKPIKYARNEPMPAMWRNEMKTPLYMAPEQVKVAVHRLRVRYRELLRAEIAQTLSDPGHVEEEMKSLFASFEN
jgi:hypothetical protein